MRAFSAAVVVKLTAGFSASFSGSLESSFAASRKGSSRAMVEWEDSGYHYMPEENVLLCTCAKCGSTSLYEFVYEELFGDPWNYTGKPFIQCVQSPRWEGKFVALESEQVEPILLDDGALSLAITRDPKQRLISAWRSKVACDGTGTWAIDTNDREWMVPDLMGLADKPPEDCLSLDDFVETLYTVHMKGRQAELDPHFRPQQYSCFRDFGPDMWFKVTTISDERAARELGIKLGDNNASEFPNEHPSGSPELVISEQAEWYLDSITKEEYEVLGFR